MFSAKLIHSILTRCEFSLALFSLLSSLFGNYTRTSMLLKDKNSAQEWIDAGLAVRGEKGKGKDLRSLPFSHAQAKAFVYLSGEGADTADREAIHNVVKPSERKAKWR